MMALRIQSDNNSSNQQPVCCSHGLDAVECRESGSFDARSVCTEITGNACIWNSLKMLDLETSKCVSVFDIDLVAF